jgi:hypothetical protein
MLAWQYSIDPASRRAFGPESEPTLVDTVVVVVVVAMMMVTTSGGCMPAAWSQRTWFGWDDEKRRGKSYEV